LFDSLTKINPDYPTIVGEINVKADNENLTSYLDIFMYANHAEAKADITDCTHDLGREHSGRCP